MRGIVSMLAVLTLAGCATGPSLQSRMSAYIGASGETLVNKFGVPDKQIALNGVQYLAYVRQQTTVTTDPDMFVGGLGGFGGPFGYGGYGFGGGYGGYGAYYGIQSEPLVTVWRCETTFLLHDDKVVSFTLRGNYCS